LVLLRQLVLHYGEHIRLPATQCSCTLR